MVTSHEAKVAALAQFHTSILGTGKHVLGIQSTRAVHRYNSNQRIGPRGPPSLNWKAKVQYTA